LWNLSTASAEEQETLRWVAGKCRRRGQRELIETLDAWRRASEFEAP
jgi:hypothetical protein